MHILIKILVCFWKIMQVFLELGTQNFWLKTNFLGTRRSVKNLERTLLHTINTVYPLKHSPKRFPNQCTSLLSMYTPKHMHCLYCIKCILTPHTMPFWLQLMGPKWLSNQSGLLHATYALSIQKQNLVPLLCPYTLPFGILHSINTVYTLTYSIHFLKGLPPQCTPLLSLYTHKHYLHCLECLLTLPAMPS